MIRRNNRLFADTLANGVLLSGGILALWALWHQFYPSGWSGPQPLMSPTAWGKSAVMSASLAAFFIASLRLRPALRRAVAGVCCSVLAVLYAIEIVLANTALGPGANVPFWGIDRASPQMKKEIAILAAKFGASVDARERIEVLDDSRQRGVDMVPAVMLSDVMSDVGSALSIESGKVDELLPLGAVSSIYTLLCNESGQFVGYTSDERGFRNPSGIWSSAHADIAVVGQSFAQGYCVPDGQGFVDLLRTRRQVVLNLGTSGQGFLLQLAAIKEYLPRYAPTTVLWIYTEGIDLADLHNELAHPMSRRYLDPAFNQNLINRQPEIDHALRRVLAGIETRERQPHPTAPPSSTIEQVLPIVKLWSLRTKVELAFGLNREQPELQALLEPTPDSYFSGVLRQARTVTSSWGGTLYFVYLPGWDRYRNRATAAERERAKVLSLVNALGIPVIDVHPSFQAERDPLSLFPFRKFGHYNERGNQVVAEAIVKSIFGT
ncbi:MAG: hypothetical protein ABI868_06220 [Acidobacteriota bacterium]